MFKNVSPVDNSSQTENLFQKVLRILSGENSSPATIKFISELQLGKNLDAIFIKKLPAGKGELSLEGNKVTVEIPKKLSIEVGHESKSLSRESLVKGQKLHVRVVDIGPKPGLRIVKPPPLESPLKNEEITTSLTSRGKSISRLSDSSNSFSSPSSSNEITTARITRIVDSKSILVEAGNKNFIIPVDKVEGFKPGSQVSIFFDPAGNGQKPVLVETGANRLDFNSLKPYLPARMPIGEMAYLLKNQILDSPVIPQLQIKSDLIKRLTNTLRLLVPGEGEIPDAKLIRQQVESSGINYEAKVRQVLETAPGMVTRNELSKDLKGLLLELKYSAEKFSSNTSQKPTNSFAAFQKTISSAIENIELNQLSSQLSKQESQPLVIQIPNPLSSGNKTIQLFVRDDSSKDENGEKGKNKNHNVAFFLDLSFLGKIKINAQMSQESLSVSIAVENEDIADFVRQRSSGFEKTMNESEINTCVECHVPQKVESDKDNLIELLVNHQTSLINIET
jgi:hypothetical protein